MYAQMFQNLKPSHVDEDTLNGMRMILDLESFADIHDLVKAKLKEIEDYKKQDSPIGGFTMAVGKYYRTVNNSVVHCYEEIINDDGLKFYKIMILSGGWEDPSQHPITAALSGNSFKVYGGYIVNDMGLQINSKNKANAIFPMHIVKEIEVQFPY